MARMTAAERKRTPASKFAGGGPKGRKGFPLTDATHDREAISGATRSFNAGNISKGTENRIKAEARSKLGIKGGKKAAPRGRPRKRLGDEF